MYSKLYFWILSADTGNCCFLKKNVFKIIFYLFFIQKPIISITQEWLVVESCPKNQKIEQNEILSIYLCDS